MLWKRLELQAVVQNNASSEEEQAIIDPSNGDFRLLLTLVHHLRLYWFNWVHDAEARLGLDPAGDYIVLGVGNNNTGVGKSMVTAPFHFLADGGSNEGIYNRYLAVFRIPEEEGAAILSNVVTVDVHDGDAEVAGLGGHITEYYHTREQ